MYTTENIMCKCCKSYDCSLSEIKGYEGMCDACACYLMSIELEAIWDAELAIYGKRTGEHFIDFNDFCNTCYSEEIDFRHLNNLTELSEIFNDIDEDKQRRQYEEHMVLDPDNDLPF